MGTGENQECIWCDGAKEEREETRKAHLTTSSSAVGRKVKDSQRHLFFNSSVFTKLYL